jgi:hypothetical protein
MVLVELYRILHSINAEYTFFSEALDSPKKIKL